MDASTRSSSSGTSMSISSNSKLKAAFTWGRAYDARRGAVLASHPPQFLSSGEGHLQPAVATGNGAFDRDSSGHFPNITTADQGGDFGHVCRVVSLINFRRQVIRFSRMIAVPVTQSQGQTHRAYMAGRVGLTRGQHSGLGDHAAGRMVAKYTQG